MRMDLQAQKRGPCPALRSVSVVSRFQADFQQEAALRGHFYQQRAVGWGWVTGRTKPMLLAGGRAEEHAEGLGPEGHFLPCRCLTKTPCPLPGLCLVPVGKVLFWMGEAAGGRLAGHGVLACPQVVPESHDSPRVTERMGLRSRCQVALLASPQLSELDVAAQVPQGGLGHVLTVVVGGSGSRDEGLGPQVQDGL